MTIYKAPKERLHRDFFYLNDEVSINSLSALESGRSMRSFLGRRQRGKAVSAER